MYNISLDTSSSPNPNPIYHGQFSWFRKKKLKFTQSLPPKYTHPAPLVFTYKTFHCFSFFYSQNASNTTYCQKMIILHCIISHTVTIYLK